MSDEAVGMNFGLALQVLKEGGRVYRRGWNGTDLYLQKDKLSDGQEFIAIRALGRLFMPWTASQADLLENDWFITVAG